MVEDFPETISSILTFMSFSKLCCMLAMKEQHVDGSLSRQVAVRELKQPAMPVSLYRRPWCKVLSASIALNLFWNELQPDASF